MSIDITSSAQAGSVTEIADGVTGENINTHTAGGTVTFTDVADFDDHMASFTAQDSGYLGSFSLNAVDQGANSVGWSFSLADADIEHLAAGQTVTQSYDVTINNGSDGTVTETITVTITGTNDAAVITGTSEKELTETNAAQSISGKLDATDVDGSADFVAQTEVNGSSGYGTFSITADGAWTYTMNAAHDEFVDGQDYTDELAVMTADGTEKIITVTITGSNDGATISGDVTGEITEDDAPSVGGTLTVADADTGEAGFQAADASTLVGNYGSFTFDAATGAWTYTLDGRAQALKEDQSVDETLEVASIDGTTQTITVTVTGSNDGATISGDVTGEITEDDAPSVGGTLTV
ncbi:VCBS repeat-containing protein, partial [Mycoplana sp. BE70]|uniref:VCBS domain-containing protein n=1 Tax=Mycoplana sp. BE70 TaxID=2817775 RepID=UPI00285A587A